MTKRFEIDVEGTTQENALFKADEFICYADDVETIIEKLNELNNENEYLIKKRGELETKNVILKGENEELKERISELDETCIKLQKENEQLKAQLYCDDEEGVCSICKYHYLVIDDEAELEWYNSRCTKGHYECGKVCLKKCEDFEKRKKKL